MDNNGHKLDKNLQKWTEMEKTFQKWTDMGRMEKKNKEMDNNGQKMDKNELNQGYIYDILTRTGQHMQE